MGVDLVQHPNTSCQPISMEARKRMLSCNTQDYTANIWGTASTQPRHPATIDWSIHDPLQEWLLISRLSKLHLYIPWLLLVNKYNIISSKNSDLPTHLGPLHLCYGISYISFHPHHLWVTKMIFFGNSSKELFQNICFSNKQWEEMIQQNRVVVNLPQV